MKIFILMFALAFVFFSCDNGDVEPPTTETNPFVGTWEDRDDTVIEQFTFTRTVQALLPENEQFNETNTGTYEYDDQIIYLDYKTPNTISIRADYLLNGNELTMTSSSTNKTYTYTKIK